MANPSIHLKMIEAALKPSASLANAAVYLTEMYLHYGEADRADMATALIMELTSREQLARFKR